jgi:hypothetical protein
MFCGTPDPSHDTMIVRAAVLAGGTAFILTPRRWLGQLRATPLRKLARSDVAISRQTRRTVKGHR